MFQLNGQFLFFSASLALDSGLVWLLVLQSVEEMKATYFSVKLTSITEQYTTKCTLEAKRATDLIMDEWFSPSLYWLIVFVITYFLC